jgi:hypothetical protein
MAAQTIVLEQHTDAAGRSHALETAIRSLVSMSFAHGRFRVDMPVILPSGSAATVTVWPEGGGETFMVTDDGAALFEVTSGAFSEPIFGRVARDRCARYGAQFDGGTMLYLRVNADQLRGAIVTMANLMKEVVDETINRSLHHNMRPIDLELWDKLERAFAGCRVERRVQLLGESTASHEFSAVVTTNKGLIAFDTFSAQGNSINSVFVKMADIGRGDAPPKGFAVTKRVADIGPKLNLINSVAQVIEVGIETETLHRLALAA